MTLLDRIQNLQLRALAADDETKIKSRVGEFTTLRNQLESATSNATRVVAARRELRAAGIRQDDPAQGRAPVLGVVEDLINVARTLPIDAKIDAARLSTRTVVDFFGRTQRWVQDNWQIAVQAALPEVDDDLLSALENAGIDVDAIRHDIIQAESALFSLRYRSLPEEGDYAKLVHAREVLSSVGERIAGLVDPKLAAVILRAQTDGVPFTEFTDEVLDGLRRLGILKRLRVRLK